MNIPEKLRTARIIKDYSIKQTAELAGISPQTYSRYERGLTSPSLKSIEKLVEVLDVDVDYLLSESNELRNIIAYVIN